MRAADLLVRSLERQGVEYIFGIPGAKIDAVFDALLDSSIKLILCRHEQNAAFKAAIYGRLTGKPGVVLVTSGPGVGNLVTGLLTATTEGDPVVALGGAVSLAMKNKASHQSADNVSLLQAATKDSLELMSAETIPEILDNAFRTATMPRSGAVFISLPQDIMQMDTKAFVPDIPASVCYGATTPENISDAANLLAQAKFPVLFLGQEASRIENTICIRKFIEKHKIPCVSTYQAAGVISRDLFPFFAGRVGLFKNQPGDQLLEQADLVMTIGFNSVEYDPEIWHTHADKCIIHIDYQPAELRETYMPKLELLGDIARNISQLTETISQPITTANIALLKTAHHEIKAAVNDAKNLKGERIHPLRFIYDLRASIDDETIVISDIGSVYMWLARYFFSYSPHHLLFSNGQQTLGVALPWAMAAKLIFPHKTIISISGDGGFLFSAMELETAVREKLHIIHFVWRDSQLNMVAEQQNMKYHRESAVTFKDIDMVKFSESFGATGYQINEADQIIPILKKALAATGPVIIDVPIDYRDNAGLFLLAHHDIIQ